MIIHLELNIELRRIEVLRLKVSDVRLGYLCVLGKRRVGGKPRINPLHPETNVELAHWFKLQEMEIAKARAKNFAVQVLDALLIYERGGKLCSYKRRAVAERLKAVCERTGIQFTNHTLRRTFGRTCWLAGIPLETIRDLLGYETPRPRSCSSVSTWTVRPVR